MAPEKDFLTFILGILGLASIVYAVKLTFEEARGTFFYVFLVIQALIFIYLLYIVVTRLKESWLDYRWSPDRLR